MKREETRSKLIEGTIRVISRDGLDKASTKQIGIETGINEVYIYRCFKDKEDMFAKMFDSLDDELYAKAMHYIEVMYMSSMEYEMRCRCYFSAIWEFLLGNRDKCLTYVRYFYSPYFTKYSSEEHKRHFEPLVEKIRVAFKDEAEVWMILNHILNVMLAFAVMVHTGQMKNESDSAEHVFRVVYRSVEQYFRN